MATPTPTPTPIDAPASPPPPAGPGSGSGGYGGPGGPGGNGRPTLTPGLRHLWRIGGAVWAALVLAWGAPQVASLLAHEEETVVTDFEAAGLTTIDVRNHAGAVHLVGTDTDRVVVTARVSNGFQDTGHSQEVIDDRLVVRGSCPLLWGTFCSVSYTIEAPTDMALRVRGEGRLSVSDFAGDIDLSTDNGRVEARRLEGDVELASDNGRVEAVDISGDLRMRSDNGRISGSGLRAGGVDADSRNGRVELVFDEAPEAVTAGSDNGAIEVVVPRTDDAYRVDADSDNGGVSTTVDQSRDSRRTITAYSDNGSVTVRYDE